MESTVFCVMQLFPVSHLEPYWIQDVFTLHFFFQDSMEFRFQDFEVISMKFDSMNKSCAKIMQTSIAVTHLCIFQIIIY